MIFCSKYFDNTNNCSIFVLSKENNEIWYKIKN